jgi:multiple antibiotic resistance protein
VDLIIPILAAITVVPIALLPIINPLSSAPVFVATVGRSEHVVQRLAQQVALNSWYVIVVSMVLGTHVLALFGLSLPVVRIGGGLVVAFNGWRMLYDTSQDDVQAAVSREAMVLSDVEIARRSFFPLTFPLTTGPGTIAAAIALGTQLPRTPVLRYLVSVAVAAAGAALTAFVLYLVFKHAANLLNRIGGIGKLVMMRLMAFILLCIGIQLLVTGWMEVHTLK